ILPKGDQQTCCLAPVLARQLLLEGETRRLRCQSPNVAPSVRHTVNVNINADLGRTARDSQREVGALRTDSAKRCHNFEVVRKTPAVLLSDTFGEIANVIRFCYVERRRPDQFGYSANAQPTQLFGRWRRFEQTDSRWQRNLVSRAYGYDAGNQLMKRRFVAVLREVEHRGVSELFNFLPYAAKHRVDVERSLGLLDTHAHCNLWVQGVVQRMNGNDMSARTMDSRQLS